MNAGVEQRFASEAEYRAAIDAVIARATRELRVFDHDLERMRLDDKARADALTEFLATSPARRLLVVVHESRFVQARAARLQALVRRFPNAVDIRESAAELKRVAECFVLADTAHGAVRFHRDHARGKLLIDAPGAVRLYLQHFDELWESATPCVSATTLGL